MECSRTISLVSSWILSYSPSRKYSGFVGLALDAGRLGVGAHLHEPAICSSTVGDSPATARPPESSQTRTTDDIQYSA